MDWFTNFASWVVNTGLDKYVLDFLDKNKYTLGLIIYFGVGFSAITSWPWDDKFWQIMKGPFGIWTKQEPPKE